MTSEQTERSFNLPFHCKSAFDLLCYYAESAEEEKHVVSQQTFSAKNHISFSVGENYFLLGLEDVKSVLNELQFITKLPFAPPWLLGLSSVRGEIVSVISLAELFEPGGKTARKSSVTNAHYILLDGEGDGFLLKVDALHGMFDLPVEASKEPERFFDGHAIADNKVWRRINLPALIKNELNEQ